MGGETPNKAGESDARNVRTLKYTKADLYVLWKRSSEYKLVAGHFRSYEFILE